MHEEVKVAIRKSIPFLQSNGEKLTSRKLANALLAFALNLENLGCSLKPCLSLVLAKMSLMYGRKLTGF